MKFLCSRCNDMISEEDVIIQDINDHVRFLCNGCYNKWCGEDD